MRDPFAELGLDSGATAAEVRAAFWARARAMHPDRHPDDPRANERFRRVVLAYEDALGIARGLPPRRRTRVCHTPPARAEAPPPVYRCPTCGDGYDWEADCPRCEVAVAFAPAPPAAHALACASIAIGLFIVIAGLRPLALGPVLVTFGTFVLLLALHEKLRPPLPATTRRA